MKSILNMPFNILAPQFYYFFTSGEKWKLATKTKDNVNKTCVYFTVNIDQLLTDRWMYTNCARESVKEVRRKYSIPNILRRNRACAHLLTPLKSFDIIFYIVVN